MYFLSDHAATFQVYKDIKKIIQQVTKAANPPLPSQNLILTLPFIIFTLNRWPLEPKNLRMAYYTFQLIIADLVVPLTIMSIAYGLIARTLWIGFKSMNFTGNNSFWWSILAMLYSVLELTAFRYGTVW